MTVHVLSKFATNPFKCVSIDTTSGGGTFRYLSPFVLGPCETYLKNEISLTFENLWQYSKVYSEYVDTDGWPTTPWWLWRARGWENTRAVRYPMGKGRKPEYTFWAGEKLEYIEARKRVYARLYALNVEQTHSYKMLKAVYTIKREVVLRDYDAYNFRELGMTYKDVVNNPGRKMGHAFVLAMMLEGCLEECLED